MIRHIPISLAVVVLFTLPRAALAQGTLPPPAPGPMPAPVAPAPVPAPVVPPPMLAPVEPAPPPVVVVTPPAPAPVPAYAAQLMTLKLMKDKGILSKPEYESALKDLQDTGGIEHTPLENSVVMGKWAATLYGFVEADNIWDSTRAFNDAAGAGQVPRGSTQAGQNGRFTMAIRNSRLGFRLKAPEVGGVRASAVIETDFLGTQLPVANPTPGVTPVNPAGTESAFFTNPTLRARHVYLKVETPVVDILAGQYWTLMGWGSTYQPNTVEIQGVPGELYQRTPQIRISKTIKVEPISLDLAVAAIRPVQRDSATPDWEGGIKFNVDSWTGLMTNGPTGTNIMPFSIAASGLIRHVAVDQFSAAPKFTNDLTMDAIAVDGFLPVLPATKDKKDNALSLQGEFVTGYGIADHYSGFTGGVTFPSLATPPGATAPPNFAADIDNGIVTYDGKGGLHGIQWTTWLVGGQYYVPGCGGKFWVSGNYSHSSSANTHYYGSAAKLRLAEDWWDVNLFVDPLPSVRVGAEFASFIDVYVDGQHAINYRGQLSGFYIF